MSVPRFTAALLRAMVGSMRPVLTHIALHVREVAASIAFYRDLCGMRVTHTRASSGDDERAAKDAERVVWMAEPGRESTFVLVLIPKGPTRTPLAGDYSHLGFALASREEVDAVAALAQARGVLRWPARQEDYPVGYYCGVVDPDGHMVEFSYGQPLGPGAL